MPRGVTGGWSPGIPSGSWEPEEFTNDRGRGLVIRYRLEGAPPGSFDPPAPLDERLDLVRGVGPATAKRLRREGYRSLADLARHPRFGREAAKAMAAVGSRDVRALARMGARDEEMLPLFRMEDAAVVDIETAGLARVLPVFLIGVALKEVDGWEVRQYFARDFAEEAAILRQVELDLAGLSVCASYNGKAFDEPFVRDRFRLHGLAGLRFRLHVDLLHTCRRLLRGRLCDFRLSTVEAHLFGAAREEDVAGHEVPDLYYRYMQEKEEAIILPVLRHNAIDLRSLAWLFEWTARGPGRWEAGAEEENGPEISGKAAGNG